MYVVCSVSCCIYNYRVKNTKISLKIGCWPYGVIDFWWRLHPTPNLHSVRAWKCLKNCLNHRRLAFGFWIFIKLKKFLWFLSLILKQFWKFSKIRWPIISKMLLNIFYFLIFFSYWQEHKLSGQILQYYLIIWIIAFSKAIILA